MRAFLIFCLIISLAGTNLVGCSSDPPQPARPVSLLIGERVHLTLPDQPKEVTAAITDRLAHPLTIDSTVQIALLNNPALAVQLEEVGIAQADFIAASQIKNPALYVDFRFPDRRPPSGTDIEATAAEDVLDILMLPLRKKIARQQLDQSAIRSADAAMQLVHDTRVAFITFLAHQQQSELQHQTTAAAAASADFARRQHDAGNINNLDLSREQAACALAQLEQARSDAKLFADREKLNRLMGLHAEQIHWNTVASLAPMPEKETDLQSDLKAADQNRLDLCDAQSQVTLAGQALEFTRNGVLTEVNIGASMERETDHQTVIGPSLGLELPIFNQHQGQIARAEAELHQAQKKLDALRIDAQSEIRLSTAQVVTNRAIVELATKQVLPQRIGITNATQQQYNGMLLGVYALLAAKQDELTARREAIDALADYWIARADEDRAMGR